jgi:hypothetical protein
MPLEPKYHVSCDVCRNYAGYYPDPSPLIAILNAEKLGWSVKRLDTKTVPGVFAKCSYCKDLEQGAA